MEKVIIDAKDKILGRLASEVALILQEKNKPSFLSYTTKTTQVVIKNVDKIKITGDSLKKREIKKFTGYIGNMKTKRLSLKESFRRAVKMMLPKNKQQTNLMNNLSFYEGE